MQLTEVTTLLYVSQWFLIQINILPWTVGCTVRYSKTGNWMMETIYSELKVDNLL